MLAIASVPALLLFNTGCATHGGAYDHYDGRDPSYGRRYQTMRALAHDLDQRAERAVERARDSAHRGRRERTFLNSLDDFARRADGFNRRLERERDARWDMRDEVNALNRDARDVNREIRDARVFERASRDWEAVLDVLDRMNRVVASNDADGYRERRGDWRDERD
jgi:nucleotide-binding universal stress UspA family protein